jgi:hypothetical protein
MGKKRYSKIFLPVLLIVIMGSVTSCFLLFMDWSGGIEGDWIYRDTAINETVFLTIGKNSVEMVFDEDSPYGYFVGGWNGTDMYFNDWGFKGDLNVDEGIQQMDIWITSLYRYYSAYHWTNTDAGTWRWGGGGFYNAGGWLWTTVPFLSNFIQFPGRQFRCGRE